MRAFYRSSFVTFSVLTVLVLTVLALAAVASANEEPSSPPAAPVAEVAGQAISWASLESRAEGELRQLELQRHRILAAALTLEIESRLLDAEAAQRKVSVAELLSAEVEDRAQPVTDLEVDDFYTANQVRIKRPKETVAAQIKDHLGQQRRAELRAALLDRLRARYAVVSHLEPWRLQFDLDGAQLKGEQTAPVTLVEFSDFQCPACKRMNPTLEQLREAYGERLKIAFRNLPLTSIHPRAAPAAEAALCAADQGKFWEMHDVLFARQRELESEHLKARARELELDTAAFDRCLDQGERRADLEHDMELARQAGIQQTPSLFVNGRPVQFTNKGTPFEQLSALIDEELQRAGK